jgi:hypothetical protein
MMAVIILDRAPCRDGDLGTSVIVRRNHMFRRRLCKENDVSTALPLYLHISYPMLVHTGVTVLFPLLKITSTSYVRAKDVEAHVPAGSNFLNSGECIVREAEQHQPFRFRYLVNTL